MTHKVPRSSSFRTPTSRLAGGQFVRCMDPHSYYVLRANDNVAWLKRPKSTRAHCRPLQALVVPSPSSSTAETSAMEISFPEQTSEITRLNNQIHELELELRNEQSVTFGVNKKDAPYRTLLQHSLLTRPDLPDSAQETDRQLCYRILCVTTAAMPRDIKQAFHRLCLLEHPDKNPDAPPRVMRQLNNAYAVLSCPVARMIYDCCSYGEAMLYVFHKIGGCLLCYPDNKLP